VKKKNWCIIPLKIDIQLINGNRRKEVSVEHIGKEVIVDSLKYMCR
jgi:hypothetical protein